MKRLIFIFALLFSTIIFSQTITEQIVKYVPITTVQRDALSPPANQRWKIFNSDTEVWEYWNGTAWTIFSGAGSGDMTQLVYDPLGINQQLLGISASQIITNKSIDADNNSVSNIGFAEFDLDTGDTMGFVNCNALDASTLLITSDGTTITASMEKTGGGDIRIAFSGGTAIWDTSPASTVTLTAGADNSHQINYIYYLESNGTFTSNTTGFPVAEYLPVATVIVQSAASLQIDGAIKVHKWTDAVTNPNGQGHLSHLNSWIRSRPAGWLSGVATSTTEGINIFTITTTSGIIKQLHDHSFPARTTPTDPVYIVNDNISAFKRETVLTNILTDSEGVTMSNNRFNLVLWGTVNELEADSKTFINLSSGSYTKDDDAIDDISNFSNYNIPSNFTGTGFLIAEITVRHISASNTWSILQIDDLRGKFPSTFAGGTANTTTEFAANTFKIFDPIDNTKEIIFDASAQSTGTTRKISMPDNDVDLGSINAGSLNGFIDTDFAKLSAGQIFTSFNVFRKAISFGENITFVMTIDDSHASNSVIAFDNGIMKFHPASTEELWLGSASITFPNLEIAEILDPKSAITKEYADANYSGGGGATNPNIFIPTTQADLSDVANIGKTASIQTDITLTSNLTLADGVILSGDGGKIIQATFTVTGVNNNIVSNDDYTTILDGNGTIDGTWNTRYITSDWFGLISDVADQGADQTERLKNMAAVANSSGSIEVHVYEGTYWYSVDTWFNAIPISNNITITGNNDIHWIGHKAIIRTLTHNYSRSGIFHLSHTERSTISGFELIGDKDVHPFTSPSTEGLTGTLHEHNMGIIISNNANFYNINNNNIHEFTGDAIYTKIQVYVGSTSLTDASFESGTIDDLGVNAVDANYERTIALIDLTDSQFQDNLHYSLDINIGGRLDVLHYVAYYYDAVGTFIEKTDNLEIFDRVIIKPEYKQMKFVIYTNTSPKLFKIINYEYPYGGITEFNELHNNIRQGISNPSLHSIIRNNDFHDIGGSDLGKTAGPGGGIDIEDGLRNNYNIWIYNNTFKNNAGSDLIIKFARYIFVYSNTFDKDDRPFWNLDGTAISNGGINADFSRGSQMHNNIFHEKGVDIGRYVNFNNNTMYGGDFTVYPADMRIKDNELYNVNYTRATSYEYTSIATIENNYNTYDRPLDDYPKIFAGNNTYHEKNNTYDFMNLSDGLNLNTILDTSTEKFGTIDGFTIKGYTGTNFNGLQTHSIDINNMNLSCPLKIQFAFEKDFTISNSTFKNWIDLDLRLFLSGNNTVTLYNMTLNVDDTGVLVGNYPLSAKAFAFNIKMIDCKVNFNFNVVKTFQFLNTGWLYMEGCEITATNAETYDFLTSSLSSSTLINNRTKNFTFTNATTQTGTTVMP